MVLTVPLPTMVDKIDSDALLPTSFGDFRIRVRIDPLGNENVLLYIEGNKSNGAPLVRIHSECLTGDAFGSLKCDCGSQLHTAMKQIHDEGVGAIVYLRQEGRGIGLAEKIRAYRLQDSGLDTLDANLALGLPGDDRSYEFAAKMLIEIGYHKVRLLTNNPEKLVGLENNGVKVLKREPHITGTCELNKGYLLTKANRMGHLM